LIRDHVSRLRHCGFPRYGESAGEATEDAFATAGHAVGTAWNLFKIRKAVTPSSSLPGNMVKSAVRNRN